MAIHCALTRLRREGFDDLPTDADFEQLCRDAAHQWRERLFTPLLTLKLFILQIAWGNTAMNHLRQLSGLAFSAGSYCEARLRLPLGALQGLLARLSASAQQGLEPGKQRGREQSRSARDLLSYTANAIIAVSCALRCLASSRIICILWLMR